MKVDIWMPIYIKDYLADTSRLSTIEQGAYLLLLFDYWINGALPNDEETLLQITKLSKDNSKIIKKITAMFFTIDQNTGKLINKRVEQELTHARNRKENGSKAGKTGGGNPNFRKGEHNPYYKPKDKPTHKPKDKPKIKSSPSPSPTPLTTTTQSPLEEDALATPKTNKQADFIDKWSEVYKQATGINYKAETADYVLIAKLLKNYTEDQIMQKAKTLFKSCSGAYNLWFAKSLGDFTIKTLSNKWNEIIEGGKKDGKSAVNDDEIREFIESRS